MNVLMNFKMDYFFKKNLQYPILNVFQSIKDVNNLVKFDLDIP